MDNTIINFMMGAFRRGFDVNAVAICSFNSELDSNVVEPMQAMDIKHYG